MKNSHIVVMAVLCVGLAGCETPIRHDYTWSEYALAPGRLMTPADLGDGQEIQVLAIGNSNRISAFRNRIGFGPQEARTARLEIVEASTAANR